MIWSLSVSAGVSSTGGLIISPSYISYEASSDIFHNPPSYIGVATFLSNRVCPAFVILKRDRGSAVPHSGERTPAEVHSDERSSMTSSSATGADGGSTTFGSSASDGKSLDLAGCSSIRGSSTSGEAGTDNWSNSESREPRASDKMTSNTMTCPIPLGLLSNITLTQAIDSVASNRFTF
ncbi:hypothetical protein ES703_37015 [subsurface metagenome]